MPRINRRTKVISVRLSTEEFDQLQTLCVSKGADSFSEVTRAAIRMLIHSENGLRNADNAIAARIDEMDLRVSALDREIARMSSLMGLHRLEENQ